MTGIVKSYNTTRGFGLIMPLIGKPNSAAMVFFHVSAIAGRTPGEDPAIPTGCEVEFDLCRGDRGPQAANVRLRVLNGSVLQGPFCDKVPDSTSFLGESHFSAPAPVETTRARAEPANQK